MSALFSTFGIDWHLLTAQVVNFTLLAFALTWFLYKPVLKMVRERQRVILKGVEDAEQAAKLFAGADSEVASRMKAAEAEAEQVMVVAREFAAAEKARLVREAEEQAALIAKDAEEHAAERIARARRESDRDIARLAMLAAEKVLNKSS